MGNLRPGNYTFGNKTKTEIIALTSGITGTGTVSASGTSMTGSGTSFLTDLYVGAIVQPTNGYNVRVSSITSNTGAVLSNSVAPGFSGQAWKLLNPNRIPAGSTVFNTTDRYPMYYSGDGIGPSGAAWLKGEFCSGQAVPVRNGATSTSLLEGYVLTTSSGFTGSVAGYTASTFDPAIAVAYHVVGAGNCTPTAVCGIHNTDFTGTTAAKGNFLQPSASANQFAVVDDGSASTGDSCGVATTQSGNPVTGEVEMLVNFQERL